MTRCAVSTRRALRYAVREYRSQAAWARAHGLAPVDVSDCLRHKPMSTSRENVLRRALGLPEIDRKLIAVSSEERVVKRPGFGRRRGYAERKVRISHAEAERIDHALARLGYRSFSEWWNADGIGRRLISMALEAAQAAESGGYDPDGK